MTHEYDRKDRLGVGVKGGIVTVVGGKVIVEVTLEDVVKAVENVLTKVLAIVLTKVLAVPVGIIISDADDKIIAVPVSVGIGRVITDTVGIMPMYVLREVLALKGGMTMGETEGVTAIVPVPGSANEVFNGMDGMEMVGRDVVSTVGNNGNPVEGKVGMRDELRVKGVKVEIGTRLAIVSMVFEIATVEIAVGSENDKLIVGNPVDGTRRVVLNDPIVGRESTVVLSAIVGSVTLSAGVGKPVVAGIGRLILMPVGRGRAIVGKPVVKTGRVVLYGPIVGRKYILVFIDIEGKLFVIGAGRLVLIPVSRVGRIVGSPVVSGTIVVLKGPIVGSRGELVLIEIVGSTGVVILRELIVGKAKVVVFREMIGGNPVWLRLEGDVLILIEGNPVDKRIPEVGVGNGTVVLRIEIEGSPVDGSVTLRLLMEVPVGPIWGVELRPKGG